MAPRPRTAFDARGLLIEDGRQLPFYAGAMHYWRVEPARWTPCLRAMRELGLTVVETYVPWRVHDRQAFTGRLDLGRFLDAAHAAGLAAMIRPGPHVNAELTGFGFPDRILTAPAMQARTAAGTPAFMPAPPRAFPIPSYASAAFQREVKAWFATVAEVVRPRLAPGGPVVAVGVDNEDFFRLGAFDLDYHPDAIAWWREAHDADPPRAAADPLAAAWVRWKDVYHARALALFASYLDDLEIARCHNLPPTEPFHYDLPRRAAAIGGPVGIDVDSARADFPAVRRRALHAVGSSETPLVLEAGVGFFPWLPPVDTAGDPDRARDQLLTALAAGIRGFNLFMAVERDRYYGAAIDRHGRVEAAWIAPLVAALVAVDWPALRRATPLALIASRADVRFGTLTSVLDPMTPIALEALLGPASELGTDPGAIQHRRWFAALEQALALAGVGYTIVDESVAAEQLAGYRAVIVPTLDRIDRGLYATLRGLRVPVVIGPTTPSRDELDQPLAFELRRVGRIKPGSLTDLPALAADLAALAGPPPPYRADRADVIVSAFTDAGDRTRVVFVQSFAATRLTATITAGPGALRDVFTGAEIAPADGAAAIPLPPRGVRMFTLA